MKVLREKYLGFVNVAGTDLTDSSGTLDTDPHDMWVNGPRVCEPTLKKNFGTSTRGAYGTVVSTRGLHIFGDDIDSSRSRTGTDSWRARALYPTYGPPTEADAAKQFQLEWNIK